MAEGKWITGLTPEMPASEAARVVLAVRLSAVRHHLPLAAEDVEHVHRLRVATRRAAAAVWVFRDFLPNKPEREAKRLLKGLRRAAGHARDWDVFLVWLQQRPPGCEAAADLLTGYVLRERIAAQLTLVDVAQDRQANLHRLCAALPTAVRSEYGEPGPELARHAIAVLSHLLAEFVAEIESNPTSPEELHQLRITGKRVRYALEVLADVCPPPFRKELYPLVEELQEILGHWRDATVAGERIEQVRQELRFVRSGQAPRILTGFDTLLETVRSDLREQEQRFRDWLTRWQQVRSSPTLRECLSPSVEENGEAS